MAQKPDDGVAVYGATVLYRHLTALRNQIDGVRQAEDIEAIHQMRVASRRLRSAFPLFGDCFTEKRVREWTEQTRQITKALGAARDADVQLEELEKAAAELSDAGYAPGLKRLALRLHQHRQSLQGDVIQALERLIASGVLDDMEKRLAPYVARQEETYLYTPALYQRGFSAISADLRAFLAYEPYVSQPECASELHAMRIAAKHVRYTMEAFTAIYPGELKANLLVIRKFQEQLGDLHDYDVWGMFLPDFLEKERALTLQFYGRLRGFTRVEYGIQALIERQSRKRDEVYQDFAAYWDKAKAENAWMELVNTIQIPYFQGEQPDHSNPAEAAQ